MLLLVTILATSVLSAAAPPAPPAPAPDDAELSLEDARKAVAADPTNARARATLKAVFVRSRRELAERTRDLEKVTITCPSLRGSISTESCLRDHVERIAADAAFIALDTDELVTAIVPPAGTEIFLTEGVVRHTRPEGDSVQLDLEVARSRAPRDPLLESVLFEGPRHVQPAQFSGPVLSADAQRVVATLPSFTQVAGVPSGRFVQDPCSGVPPRMHFAVSLIGQGSFMEERGLDGTATAITDAATINGGVRISLKKQPKPLELRWPVPEKDIAYRGDQAWASTPVKFPSRPAEGCNR